jgi:uncharacterized RDD family membrane protein YckC
MEFNEDAKRDIEKNLKEITNNINLDEKDRTDIEKELRSTYYEAAEASAMARGANAVTADDVKTARAGMCSPKETAESYMKSYASTLRRAGFWSRLVAFIIDNITLAVLVMVIMIPLILLALPFDDITINAGNSSEHPLLVAAFIILGLISIISAMIVVFGYYIVLEGHYGATVGKHIMGLRVYKTDGTKIGYKEALLRNLSKYLNNLIVIDVLIMLLFFNKEKQRGFDKIANTMVVHTRSR